MLECEFVLFEIDGYFLILAMKIHISEQTNLLLEQDSNFITAERGTTTVKVIIHIHLFTILL
jgi:hypothetical protein